MASLLPPLPESFGRFRTLPPADADYRAAQLDALVAEAFAAKRKPAHLATRCPVCTFPISVRERIARTADGSVYHAGCHTVGDCP